MRHFFPNPICVNGSVYFHTFQYSGVFTGIMERINSFVSSAPFLYPLNISENRKGQNQWNGTKLVKIFSIKWKTSLLCKKNFILLIVIPCIEARQILLLVHMPRSFLFCNTQVPLINEIRALHIRPMLNSIIKLFILLVLYRYSVICYLLPKGYYWGCVLLL